MREHILLQVISDIEDMGATDDDLGARGVAADKLHDLSHWCTVDVVGGGDRHASWLFGKNVLEFILIVGKEIQPLDPKASLDEVGLKIADTQGGGGEGVQPGMDARAPLDRTIDQLHVGDTLISEE